LRQRGGRLPLVASLALGVTACVVAGWVLHEQYSLVRWLVGAGSRSGSGAARRVA